MLSMNFLNDTVYSCLGSTHYQYKFCITTQSLLLLHRSCVSVPVDLCCSTVLTALMACYCHSGQAAW